jgi:hypothetical protein
MGEARTLRARDQFAHLNPDLPPLPVTYDEREASKKSGGTLVHALALFARSLESWNYNLDKHSSFDAYMRGLLCSPQPAGIVRRHRRRLSAKAPGRIDPGAVLRAAGHEETAKMNSSRRPRRRSAAA